jgi:alanyl-tRNA synthetase
MEMACGKRALAILNSAYDQNRQVSQAFSAKIQETGEAARKMNDLLAAQKYRISGLEKQIFAGIAAGYAGSGNVLHFEADLDGTGVRELADAIAEICGGTASVFSGNEEGGYAFCLISRTDDLRQLGKDMTKTLNGRGGGKPNCQQGRVQAGRSAIEAFFAQK